MPRTAHKRDLSCMQLQRMSIFHVAFQKFKISTVTVGMRFVRRDSSFGQLWQLKSAALSHLAAVRACSICQLWQLNSELSKLATRLVGSNFVSRGSQSFRGQEAACAMVHSVFDKRESTLLYYVSHLSVLIFVLWTSGSPVSPRSYQSHTWCWL